MQISQSGLNGMTYFCINQIKSSDTSQTWQQLWEIISSNLMGWPLPLTLPIILFITKWNCHRDLFFFSFLFNNGALFLWAIWSHCWRPVNFWAPELHRGPPPPLVCVHSFVLFSAAYWLCPSEKPGSWAIARGSKRSSSDQVNRLHKTCTSRKHRAYLHNVDLRDLNTWEGLKKKSVNYET